MCNEFDDRYFPRPGAVPLEIAQFPMILSATLSPVFQITLSVRTFSTMRHFNLLPLISVISPASVPLPKT